MEIDVDKVLAGMKKAAATARNEEELRIKNSNIIENDVLSKMEDIPAPPKYEYTLVTGARTDALYGHVLIEYKAPGKLSSQKEIAKAKEQLVNYIRTEADEIEYRYKMYLGVILSDKVAFVRYDENEKIWTLRGPYDINRESVIRLVEAIRGLRRKKLSVEELLNDFGPKSELAKSSVKILYNKVINTQNEKVKILFDDWVRLFSQVCAYSPKKLKGLEKEYDLKDVDDVALLFAIHTYYALFMKLLAAEITYLFGTGKWLRSYVSEIEDAHMKGIDALGKTLEDLESGGVFRNILGITNFVEGDYFSWYLSEFDEEVAEIVSEIAKVLSDYEPATPILEPEYAKDLLKRLYQHLVPRNVRHDLGEFYTPDWLADLVLDESGFTVDNFERIAEDTDDSTAPLQLRLLDPACGSGTFLTLAIKRVKEYAENHYLKEFLGDYVLNNIVGYDLNPLAVLSARTNYLLAIADSLNYTKQIEIPIYLADSLLVETKATITLKTYVIRSSVGNFEIPKQIVDDRLLGNLLGYIEEKVGLEYNSEQFNKFIADKLGINDEYVLDMISKLYSYFLELEKAGKNRIWTSIIRNAFAPLLEGEFDFVVGNPPWINWESLPSEYRERSKDLWSSYDLLEGKGKGMGRVKREIAKLFVARCLDRYTKNDGRLAFLIPFTVFKTQAGSGFRGFLAKGARRSLNKNIYKVSGVHDLVTLYPFEGAVNRSAMIIVEKGGKTEFPIPCILWHNPRSRGVDSESSLREVKAATRNFEMAFIPAQEDKPWSTWMQVTEKAYEGLKKIFGGSGYRGYEGVNTGLNQIYWIEILDKTSDGLLIRNPILPGQKKKVEVVEEIVEEELVYPLIRGRDVKKWFVEDNYRYIIVPHESTGKSLSEDKIKTKYPKSYSYFFKFKKDLEKRSIHKLWGKNKPFYSVYDIGNYTYSPYKIVWKEISGKISGKADFLTCVLEPPSDPHLGNKIIIPDHKLMLVPIDSKDKAHYVSGVLNSNIVSLMISTIAIETTIDPRVIENIKLPEFNPENSTHQKISDLSKKAHEIAKDIYKNNKKELKSELKEIEDEIDQHVAQLYDITEEELYDIKKCLRILKKGEFEEEEIEEELENVQVIFNTDIKPSIPGLLEVTVLNPQEQKVKVELDLFGEVEVLNTEQKEDTLKIDVKPLKSGEYKFPYKVVVDGEVTEEDNLNVYVEEEKKVRKKDKLDDKFDELL